MIYFSTAQQVIEESIKKLKSINQDSYFKTRDMAIDYYTFNNTEKYIKKYFAGTLQDEIPLYPQALTRRLINRVSMVYKNAPVRMIENDTYEQLTATKDFKLKTIERTHNLLGTVGVHIGWNGEAFTYNPLINFEPIFYADNPNEPVAVTYAVNKTTGSRLYTQEDEFVYWSATEHFKFNQNGRRYPATDDNPEMINPLGMIPIVFLQPNTMIDEFWNDNGGDIVIANRQIDIAMTLLQHHMRSSGGQYVASGRIDENKVEFGLNKLVVMEDGTMSNLNPNTNITSIIDGIKFQLMHIFQNHHITFDYGISGNKSGVSLRIENLELLESREDDVDKYRMAENQMYAIEQRFAEVYGNIALPSDFNIDFAEVEFPLNEQDDEKRWEFWFKHGIKDKADYLIAKDPDRFVDRESAQKHLDERMVKTTPEGGTQNSLIKALQSGNQG